MVEDKHNIRLRYKPGPLAYGMKTNIELIYTADDIQEEFNSSLQILTKKDI